MFMATAVNVRYVEHRKAGSNMETLQKTEKGQALEIVLFRG